MTTYRDVLRVREFRGVFLADVLSLLGDQLTKVALTVLVYAQTGSPLLSAAVFAVTYVPWLVGGPVLAAVADRLPARPALVGADLVRALLVAVMALGGLPVWALLLLLLGVEVLSVPFSSRITALVPDLLEEEAYPVGAGLLQAVHQGCQVAGFAAAGLLLAVVPTTTALLLDAATFALSGLLLHRHLQPRPALVGEERGSVLRDAADGLAVVVRTPRTRLLLLVAWTACAVLVVPEALAVAYVAATGGDTGAVGLLLAAGPLGTVVGGVVVTRFLPASVHERLLVPLVWLASAPLLLGLLRPDPLLLAAVVAVAGAGGACLVLASTTVGRETPPELRARVFGIASSGLMVAQGVAVVGAGALASVLPVHHVLAGTGVLGLVLGALLARSWARAAAPPLVAEAVPVPV